MQNLTTDQLAVWKQLQWATTLIMSRFRRDLAGAGLSLEQFDVLVHLAWAPSGTLPLHELTASMVVPDALSRSGITRLLDRMERDGLISRTVSATDRRRFDVSLTPPGRQRFEQTWPAHADGIGRYFVQPLTPRDIGDLGRILHALIQANQNHDHPAKPSPAPGRPRSTSYQSCRPPVSARAGATSSATCSIPAARSSGGLRAHRRSGWVRRPAAKIILRR